tara:strand:- start:204 stop:2156 length:1953 start_codon:yes stop_codon:yes gene_type:complete
MQFAPEFLDDIRTHVPLVKVVGRRVQLVKRGQEFVGLCPFHNEKTPSFTVNEEKGFFHCFGCGVHGDVISFVMQDEGLAFQDAVKKLAAEGGIKLPVANSIDREKQKEYDSLYMALEVACNWFKLQLDGESGSSARLYLANRGLNSDVINNFKLGFAPDGKETLKKELERKGINDTLSLSAGLLSESSKDGKLFDRFRRRIMFPIYNNRRHLVGFGGRALGDAQPKYLNSPETKVFHKSTLLYGLYAARKLARNNNQIVVVEGYTDVLSLHQAGIKEVVAPLGTALSEIQLEELWRIVDEPILCFDGDEAGKRAANRVLEKALGQLKPGKSLRFVTLANGEDPDSLVQSAGPQAFRSLISGSEPLSTMLWRMAGGEERLDTPESRLAVSTRINALLSKLKDSDTRKFFRQYYREKLFSFKTMNHPVKNFSRNREEGRDYGLYDSERYYKNNNLRSKKPTTSLSKGSDSAMGRQKSLLRVFISFPILAEEFHEELERFPFNNLKYQKMRDVLINVTQHLANTINDSESYKYSEQAKIELRNEVAKNNLEDVFIELEKDNLIELKQNKIDKENPDDELFKKARVQIRHLLDLHHRLVSLEAFKHEATEAFAANMSEENWDKLIGALRSLEEAPGIEELVSGVQLDKKNTKNS